MEPEDQTESSIERDPADKGSPHVQLHDGDGAFFDAELLVSETPGDPSVSGEDGHTAVAALAIEGEDDRSRDHEAALTAEHDKLAVDVAPVPNRIGTVTSGAAEDQELD